MKNERRRRTSGGISSWIWSLFATEDREAADDSQLKIRLERMKRRTLIAGKGDQLETHTNHIVTNQRKELLFKRKRPTVYDLPPTTRKQLLTGGGGHLQPEQDSNHHSQHSTVCANASKGGSKQQRVQQSRWVKKEQQSATTPQSSPHRLHPRGSKLGKQMTKDADAEDGEQREGRCSLEDPIDEESYEWTRMLYPCLSDLRVDVPDPDLPGGPVLVPSWRHRSLSSSSADNTGEELTDEVFDRRHGKLEVDERKRKRWDAQRIRELREHDRLESKARRKELGVWDDTLLSFHPDAVEARKVQVEETVPVVAFGALVPINETGNFDIPWFDAKERESADTKRQTRSRACKN